MIFGISHAHSSFLISDCNICLFVFSPSALKRKYFFSESLFLIIFFISIYIDISYLNIAFIFSYWPRLDMGNYKYSFAFPDLMAETNKKPIAYYDSNMISDPSLKGIDGLWITIAEPYVVVNAWKSDQDRPPISSEPRDIQAYSAYMAKHIFTFELNNPKKH
jgi:hypothetical protein